MCPRRAERELPHRMPVGLSSSGKWCWRSLLAAAGLLLTGLDRLAAMT